MSKLQRGAFQAVKNCMKINSKDKVVIVTDLSSRIPSSAIEKECRKITSDVKIFFLENFGKRPLTKLPKEIENAVKNSTAVFYMADSMPGEKASLRKPIVKLGTKKGREAHMPNITKQIMEQGMNTDYSKISKISKKVYDIVKKAEEIKVTTEKGTDFTTTFNTRWKWIIADGDIPKSPIKWSNLPDGEVFTCPNNLTGKIVVDGCVGDYFIEYGILKNPIIIDVENSKVTSLTCKNKKLETELRKYMKQDKNASRIGEFSIGTNIGLKKLIGNLLQDEKFPGIHVAIGDSYPEETKAPFPSKAHCDFVIQKTNIFVDNKQIMKQGKFLI